MSKFKVGDRVRNAGYPDFGRLGEVGTIIEDDKTNCPYLVRFSDGGRLWRTESQLEPENQAESIHITHDGSTVQAVHKRSGEIIQRATAKCSPDDTFDFLIGAELAFQRLMHPEVKKAPANKYEGMSDDELSVAICSDRRCDNWGSTGKNCPSRPYCHDGKGSYAYILEHRSEAISYLLAEDEVKQDKPAEPAKAEPVKLYCIKDHAPGEWTTKGKIYEKQADGRIRFDDGYCAEPMPFGSAAKSLVPLVKRPAKVGEWVYITSDDGCTPEIKIGNIYQVKTMASTAGWVRVLSESFGTVRNDEYLVLDGYHPEPKQPKPQYWSGKVVCIKGGKYHALGAVYEIKDGIINHNTGDGYNGGAPVQSVKQLNDASVPQFAEFKGEAHD